MRVFLLVRGLGDLRLECRVSERYTPRNELLANRPYWNFRSLRWVRYDQGDEAMFARLAEPRAFAHDHHFHTSVRLGLATPIDPRLWKLASYR